ncbi:MAG: hypothetical protein KIT32_08105 [Rhodocyclaceae bacterium]|nr:hypothetical protein [Rhodocyclaceae bacterium]
MRQRFFSALSLLLFAGDAFAIQLNGFDITAPLVPADQIPPGGSPREAARRSMQHVS